MMAIRRLVQRLRGRSGRSLEVELQWLEPPEDPTDASAWDRYWSEQIAHGMGPPLHDMFINDSWLVEAMRQTSMSRVLCAGNGISLEPRALAAAGLEVVALDLSAYALDVARQFPGSDQLLARFVDLRMIRAGGSVDFVVGDILDRQVAQGPFDLVIERRTVQAYQEKKENPCLDLLADRLGRDGILLSHVHDGGWRPGRRERPPVTQSWFEARGWPLWSGEGPKPPGRVGCVALTTG